MTSRDFCYWFQGYLEVQNPSTIEQEQVEMIKKHLNMVFVHEIDPSYGGEEVQNKLNEVHNPSLGTMTSEKPPAKPHRPLRNNIIARC